MNNSMMVDSSLMIMRYDNNNTYSNKVSIWVAKNEKENIFVSFLEREIAENTRIGYEYDIKHFFKVDDVRDITLDDVLRVTPDAAKNYKKALLDSGLNRGSVRTKITHLKTLFKFIMDECFDNQKGIKLLQGNPFVGQKVKTVGKHIENGSNKYGGYTREEVSKLIKHANDNMRKDFALLYEFAARTAIRKDPLLKLNLYTDFKMIQGKWCVIVEWDKTHAGEPKPITNEMYKMCCDMATPDGKIFMMSQATINNQLRKDSIAIGISEEDIKERKLVFHSLKSTSTDMAFAYSGNDIVVVKEHAGHSSIDTTLRYYAGKNKNPNNDISNKFELHDVSYDRELEDRLGDMDKMELVKLIMGFDKDTRDGLLESLIVAENRNKIVAV